MDQSKRPSVYLIEAPLLNKIIELIHDGIYPDKQVKEVNHYIRALTMLPPLEKQDERPVAKMHVLKQEE